MEQVQIPLTSEKTKAADAFDLERPAFRTEEQNISVYATGFCYSVMAAIAHECDLKPSALNIPMSI
jgi:hypothetical protein